MLLRRARERAAERLRDRSPENWGVSAEILKLPTAADVSTVLGARAKVIHARRSDAFSLLHQAKRYDDAGVLVAGISDDHHKCAQRYIRDWMERMGVRTVEEAMTPIDQVADAGGAVQRMIDAGRRIDETHRHMGRVSVRVLRALVEPMMRGEVRVWRVLVKQVTGETEAHAQGAMVRVACEDLLGAYEEIDGVVRELDETRGRAPIRVWRAE